MKIRSGRGLAKVAFFELEDRPFRQAPKTKMKDCLPPATLFLSKF
ncbi:hypothetical protein [Hugenholtzia roseola]|nr:hypothetical protein [Hugenholtzia roseola]